MRTLIGRRQFLKGAGSVVALGAADACRFLPGAGRLEDPRAYHLAPLRLSVDHITRRLISQSDATYALRYQDVSFVPRRDGLLLQVTGENDYYGYGDETTVADHMEAEHAVTTIASLFPGMATGDGKAV